MDKRVKISESQLRRLFGDSFVKYISEDTSDGQKDSVGFNTYGGRYDEPNRGGYIGKVRNLGHTSLGGKVTDPQTEHPEENVGLPESKNGFADSVVRYIYKMNGGPVNILDALEIVNKLKGKDISREIEKVGVRLDGEVKQFLDTLDIATIFSNYLVMDQQDYVYYRLANLSEQEIKTIKDTYGRDFSSWGTKCDGCGLEVWKTNVFVNRGDDAHISFEYMGSAGKSQDGKSLGEMKTYRIPFQIHHMNENPMDNSPLNLSCLCPNCHSLTGSYGMNKAPTLNAGDIKKLAEAENRNTPEENDKIAQAIKERLAMGHFSDTTISKQMANNAGIDQNEISDAVDKLIEQALTWYESDKMKPRAKGEYRGETEPKKVLSIGGRDFYASYVTRDDSPFIRLYNDTARGEQTEVSSNFRPELVKVDAEHPERAKERLVMFINRTLQSTKTGSKRIENWDKPANFVKSINDLSKEKDPEAYQKMLDDMSPKNRVITNPVNWKKADELLARFPNSPQMKKVADKLRATPDR